MFDFLSRHKLERRGLSSGKKRRTVSEGGLSAALRNGIAAKIGIFLIFAIATVIFLGLRRDEAALFGNLFQMPLIVVVIVGTLALQFYLNHAASFELNSRVVLVLSAIFLHLALLDASFIPVRSGLDPSYTYLLPAYAFAPMLVSILLGRNHGAFVAVYVSLLGGLFVAGEHAFNFAIFSLVCGFAAVYMTYDVRRRGKVVRAGLYVGVIASGLAVLTGLIDIGEMWPGVGQQLGTTVLIGFLTAILVSGMLPILEGLFRITTEISWIELSDLNHPLLKRMTIEAPGTYHHSLVVARLSEAAAESIGANESMCRVAAYFHDIGKLNKPQYFIENTNQDENPHDALTPTMSALIIVAHVKDGIDLALKHNLNDEIISVIREHHGTTLVQYFYHRALEQRREFERKAEEGKAKADDAPVVEKKTFRYPGPRPQTRESAIISLADGVESASRALAKPTPLKLEQLIEEITQSRVEQGQLDSCGLTFVDLARIRKSFYNTLCGMMHNRISYPKESDGDDPKPKEKKNGGPKLEVVSKDGEGKKVSNVA
ncbi:MAG: putative nucleotidyltransferase with HDIG domain [Verrucomicrobiales bacterium]|jgi:putative nucleotidyltransferase with HDIG domain